MRSYFRSRTSLTPSKIRTFGRSVEQKLWRAEDVGEGTLHNEAAVVWCANCFVPPITLKQHEADGYTFGRTRLLLEW